MCCDPENQKRDQQQPDDDQHISEMLRMLEVFLMNNMCFGLIYTFPEQIRLFIVVFQRAFLNFEVLVVHYNMRYIFPIRVNEAHKLFKLSIIFY